MIRRNARWFLATLLVGVVWGACILPLAYPLAELAGAAVMALCYFAGSLVGYLTRNWE